MKSRKVIVGVAGIGVLTVASLVGTVVGNPILERVASTLLLAAVALLVLNATVVLRRTEQQVRRNRSAIRERTTHVPRAKELKPPASSQPAMTTADLIGTIRLLQAQYVGRLDRAQAALDAAVARLSTDERQNHED